MRGLMRILIMFGPMIFRQIQRMQRNKPRRQPQPRQRELPQRERRGRMQGNPNPQRGQPVELKDLNEELGRESEQENFELKEEEIMLDKDDLKHYSGGSQSQDVDAMLKKNNHKQENLLSQEDIPSNKTPKPDSNSDLDLKDLFLDDIDDAKS